MLQFYAAKIAIFHIKTMWLQGLQMKKPYKVGLF